MKERFPSEVEAMLREAGWYPGRSELPVELPNDYSIFPWARKALEEFGGLHVGSSGPGRDLARSNIQFEPDAAEGLAPHVSQTDDGLRLYPLGEIDNGHAHLLIDELGSVYYYFDELEKVGVTLDEALINLLLGMKAG
ncbi:SUKH-3 domain-containing protein [Luteolibacter soli]|uniref:SUKH-3 domain-containing protein n=1 Tax=Luteolibacter soli TaxID=3135280 RepID=A0ABU9AQI3_9BACT